MQKISIYQIIQKIMQVDSTCIPFYTEFNFKRFVEKLNAEIQKLDNYEILDLDRLYEIVYAIDLISLAVEDLLYSIDSILEEVDTQDIYIIEEIIKVINYDYCAASQSLQNSDLKNSPFSLFQTPEIENVYGQSINISDYVEMGVDIVNTAIGYIWKHNKGKRKKLATKNPYNKEVHKLLFHFNLLVVLKGCFTEFIYEFSSLNFVDNEIKFRYTLSYYYKLKSIGKTRYNNHLFEMYIYGQDIKNESMLPAIDLSNNTIYVKPTKERYENDHANMNLSTVLNYYFFLREVRLEQLDGIYVQDICKVISEIKSLLSHTNHLAIAQEVQEVQSLQAVPIKISKKRFLEFLHQATEINAKTVQKILNILSGTFGESIDFWKTPLISYGENYIFLFASMENGHTAYFLDKFITRLISKKDQIKYFIREVLAELDHLSKDINSEK